MVRNQGDKYLFSAKFLQGMSTSTYFHFSPRWENVELYRNVLRSVNTKYGTSEVAAK